MANPITVYLAGSIRDGVEEDIAWRERAITALDPEYCTVLSPLAGRQYNADTKIWSLYGGNVPDSKYIVHADYWCVDRADLFLVDLRSLATGYASIGTISEWGRSTARSILRLVTVAPNQKGGNAMFGLHPFIEQHAAKVFNDIDEMIKFARNYIRAVTINPNYRFRAMAEQGTGELIL